ncbi:hypothetical protein HPB48_000860 [Haemaphysalis longicornis]|uniref:Uncharacterized protein n=1 Tax=Haemaphysalis longicornis TaxID=44386 RepID=A0A9J6GYJ7_HAELO|nr:hypothetical protein HPB48_000860 [Haemaphysalis longicornis]
MQTILKCKEDSDAPIDPIVPAPYVDSKLQHMWDAYRSIEARWKKHRHRKTLRIKLQNLKTAIAKHADYLTRMQWLQACDEMRGTLSMKRTWAILRKLIDPSNNKTESAKKITKLIQDYEGTAAANAW